MIETKVKEIKSKDEFPALFSTENRASVILVYKELINKYEGIVVHPKQSFGEYSMNWTKTKYHRMEKGSEVVVKIIQP